MKEGPLPRPVLETLRLQTMDEGEGHGVSRLSVVGSGVRANTGEETPITYKRAETDVREPGGVDS